jgi:hypothetical protein
MFKAHPKRPRRGPSPVGSIPVASKRRWVNFPSGGAPSAMTTTTHINTHAATRNLPARFRTTALDPYRKIRFHVMGIAKTV